MVLQHIDGIQHAVAPRAVRAVAVPAQQFVDRARHLHRMVQQGGLHQHRAHRASGQHARRPLQGLQLAAFDVQLQEGDGRDAVRGAIVVQRHHLHLVRYAVLRLVGPF